MQVAPVAERRAALDAEYPEWTPLTLHGALDQAALRHGKRPFIITDDRSWTYAELLAWSKRLGSGLVDQSQKMTVAARAMAERKTVGHRS